MKFPSPRLRWAFCLSALLFLTALLRCWNFADVFVAGKTFFVDPDCYSRMTRVERVVAHPGTVIERHEFENWPDGIRPHTTAPFDYLIAAFSLLLRPLMPDGATGAGAVTQAGAWISVALGVAAAAFLGGWAGRLGLPYRVPMILLFATSPILVHGTALGRPDHQSLLILCMAVALGSEAALLARPSRGWGMAAGIAWGLGLWVSLYEPALLLVASMGLVLGLDPKSLIARERRAGWAAMAAVLLLAGWVDGWHLPTADPVVLRYFPNWSRSIGELNSIPPWSSVFLRWTVAILPLAPVLLILAAVRPAGWNKTAEAGRDRVAWFWLGLLIVTAGLTCWQARWGYFLALVFILSLPWQLAALERLFGAMGAGNRWGRWAVVAVFGLSLWPVARDWEDRLGLSEKGRPELARRIEQRRDNLALYEVAQRLKAAPHPSAVLAPWWQSPALAYWSGQPCVAGSSHQSLPGTVDSARFYLGTDLREAAALLARRKVAFVVAYDPGRVWGTSAAILGEEAGRAAGESADQVLGAVLFTRPHSPPPGFELVFMNQAFRLFLRKGAPE